jgi:hypothetical protein
MTRGRICGAMLGAVLVLAGAGCGGGSSGGCTTAESCPGIDDFCKLRTCTSGTCGWAYTEEGTALPDQTAHDCLQVVCDGLGGTSSVAYDADLPVDDNSCTGDVCLGGVASNPPLEAGTTCGAGLRCDGAAACVGCLTAGDCPGVDTTCRTRTCNAGTCGTANADEGASCDDGDASTVGDACAAGICAGVDHCAGVTCTALDQCHDAGTCVDHATGACSNPAKTNGTACDDGSASTVGDACTGGVCAGVDHCAGVTCTALDQCHDAGTCVDHATGACSNPAKTSGTACDDGNASTAGDVCTAGVCAGVDHCIGVICTALDQCHDAGTCVDHATGACSNPAKTNGTACDDGNASTAGDACTAGVCAGVDHCIGVTCTALDQCHDAGTCVDHATGACSNPAKLDGTSCDDGNACTADACSGGACAGTALPAGTDCGGGLFCDGLGACKGAPVVTSTTPADGGSAPASTSVSVTFDQAMNPATLTAQQALGPCSGSIQVSLDGFASCVAFSSASPAMSDGGRIATLTPAPGLLVNRNSGSSSYKIRVTTAAGGAGGLSMAAAFTSTVGFDTTNPIAGAGAAQNESGGAGEANYCAQYWPPSLTAPAGSTSPVTGWAGDARYSGGYDLLVTEVGWGPANRNPQYQDGWTWVSATYFNTMLDQVAEYIAYLTLPAPGTYAYGFRVSLDAGLTWTYCDGHVVDAGAGSGPGLEFKLENLGVLISQ